MLLNTKAASREAVYELRNPRAKDGDTIEAEATLGFHVSLTITVRLKGFYAPELAGEMPSQGLAARERLQAFLNGKALSIRERGLRLDLHGRWLGTVLADGLPLNPHEVLGPYQLTPEAHAAGLNWMRRHNRKGGAPF